MLQSAMFDSSILIQSHFTLQIKRVFLSIVRYEQPRLFMAQVVVLSEGKQDIELQRTTKILFKVSPFFREEQITDEIKQCSLQLIDCDYMKYCNIDEPP